MEEAGYNLMKNSEPCEVHHEEDNTPAQLEALENFYTEHTYPNEKKMKADFAKKVGLSEKQQDLSSGVIQDRGSGLKQDSCSSNKQGSYRYFDLKEVESRRFDGPDYATSDRPYSKRVYNTSSGSSSTSHERLFPHKGGRGTHDMENLRYPNRSSNSMLISEVIFTLGDEIENAAIISVKKQLGRLFCEDGPPLGIEFQSLPPGAFDSPVRNQVNDTYQMADPVRQNSHGISKGCKESRIEMRYPRNHHETYPQGSYPDGEHIKRTKSEYVRIPSMDMRGSSEDEPPMINSKNNFRRSKYGVEGMVSNNNGNPRLRPSLSKFSSGEPSDLQLHKYDYPRARMLKRKEYLEPKPLNLVNQHKEAFDSVDGEENVHRDWRTKDYANHVRAKKSLKNDMKVGRRVRADFPSRAPGSNELLPCRNRTKEHIGDGQTSFYEDAAAETSSSMD
ncbi:hypothetical protein MKW92_037833 [Papaver armeniacum]|nr:hypothetical protein MKW92_037833 [Papaver armeniacum]